VQKIYATGSEPKEQDGIQGAPENMGITIQGASEARDAVALLPPIIHGEGGGGIGLRVAD